MPSNTNNNTSATTAATTPPPTDSSSANNNSNSNNNRPRNNNNNRNINTQHTDLNSFEGSIPEVGAVLGLKYERLKKKATSFESFLEKTSTYIISNLKDGADTKSIFKTMTDPTTTFKSRYKPSAPSETGDSVDKDIYREEVKLYVTRQVNLRRNVEKIFGIVWGQCSSALQSNIKAITEFSEKHDILDTIWLIRELKKATSGIDNKSYPEMNILDAIGQLFETKQGENESNDRFLERFKSSINTLELSQGKYVFCPTALIKPADLVTPTNDELEQECEKMKAALLLKVSDTKRYGTLSDRLRESMTLGRNEYPTILASMYELIVRQRKHNNNNNYNNRNGVSLLQRNTRNKNKNKNNNNKNNNNDNNNNDTAIVTSNNNIITTQNDDQISFPQRRRGLDMLQFGSMFTQSQDRVINPNWILLDTCSTDNVFCNEQLVSNLRKCNEGDGIEIITNGGFATYDHVADAILLPVSVFFNAESIANVLSFDKISNLPNVHITTDTKVEKAFLVHISSPNTVTTLKFSSCDDGLYFFDASHLITNKTKSQVTDYLSLSRNKKNVNLLNTVENNKTFFTKRQISRADLARQTQQNMGWPATNVFKPLVTKKILNKL